MTNPDSPATTANPNNSYLDNGYTKREDMSLKILLAMVSNGHSADTPLVATTAVRLADQLINKLNAMAP